MLQISEGAVSSVALLPVSGDLHLVLDGATLRELLQRGLFVQSAIVDAEGLVGRAIEYAAVA